MAFQDLLTPDELNEFRDSMTDVKATFHKTPVYYKRLTGEFSRYNGDRKDKSMQSLVLDGFVEYGIVRENDRFVFDKSGVRDGTTIKITFNVDYLDSLGLWDSTTNTTTLNGKDDELHVKGDDYLIIQLAYEGEISDRPIHVIMYADPKAQKS